MGYLIPKNMIDEDNIPVFNINDLFKIYLDYQKQYSDNNGDYDEVKTISKQTAKLQVK